MDGLRSGGVILLDELDKLGGPTSPWLEHIKLEVHDLLVRPDLRRGGRGKGLLLRALGDASERGARRAYLELRVSNAAARALYEHLGFEVLGTRARYYADGQDAVLMGVDLPLVTGQ